MKMHQRSDSTFADLHNAVCRELRVFACNLNKRNATEFSYRKTPYVKVVYAVRASMGAPLFFEAWQFPDGKPDNDIDVDGGTVLNYPINAFDQHGEVDDSTVGFHLDNLSGDEHLNDLKHAPELLNDFEWPDAYFDEVLRKYPMLFTGAKGCVTHLHFDMDLSDVMQTQFIGKKRVLLFPYEEQYHIYRRPFEVMSFRS